MPRDKYGWTACFTIFFLFFPSQIFSQQEVIEERKKIMKSNNEAGKAIKKAFAQGDFATLEAKANKIAMDMDKFLILFPKGSNGEKSRAKPEIWDKWEDFRNKAADMKNAATELASAAKTKDMEKVGPLIAGFGSKCDQCHDSYRGPRKR